MFIDVLMALTIHRKCNLLKGFHQYRLLSDIINVKRYYYIINTGGIFCVRRDTSYGLTEFFYYTYMIWIPVNFLYVCVWWVRKKGCRLLNGIRS